MNKWGVRDLNPDPAYIYVMSKKKKKKSSDVKKKKLSDNVVGINSFTIYQLIAYPYALLLVNTV